jgi:hypothetical protein
MGEWTHGQVALVPVVGVCLASCMVIGVPSRRDLLNESEIVHTPAATSGNASSVGQEHGSAIILEAFCMRMFGASRSCSVRYSITELNMHSRIVSFPFMARQNTFEHQGPWSIGTEHANMSKGLCG